MADPCAQSMLCSAIAMDATWWVSLNPPRHESCRLLAVGIAASSKHTGLMHKSGQLSGDDERHEVVVRVQRAGLVEDRANRMAEVDTFLIRSQM